MTTENESDQVAVHSDLEFQEHLKSLELASVEEYIAWCAQHGFSPRVKKRWLDRCKERYYAAEQQIRGRHRRG